MSHPFYNLNESLEKLFLHQSEIQNFSALYQPYGIQFFTSLAHSSSNETLEVAKTPTFNLPILFNFGEFGRHSVGVMLLTEGESSPHCQSRIIGFNTQDLELCRGFLTGLLVLINNRPIRRLINLQFLEWDNFFSVVVQGKRQSFPQILMSYLKTIHDFDSNHTPEKSLDYLSTLNEEWKRFFETMKVQMIRQAILKIIPSSRMNLADFQTWGFQKQQYLFFEYVEGLNTFFQTKLFTAIEYNAEKSIFFYESHDEISSNDYTKIELESIFKICFFERYYPHDQFMTHLYSSTMFHGKFVAVK